MAKKNILTINYTLLCNKGSNGGPGGFFQRESAAQHHCPYCPQSFLFQSILKRHLRTHTGEKPYECPNCDYRSAYKYHVARHMKLHSAGVAVGTRSDAVSSSSSSSSSTSSSLLNQSLLLSSQNLSMIQATLLGPEESALDSQLLPPPE